MTYRVDLTARARRDLGQLYRDIQAANSKKATDWFNGLEAAILSLSHHPNRSLLVPGDDKLRCLLYGSRRNVYRVIYAIDDQGVVVTVLNIRHSHRQLPASEELGA